MSDLTPEFPFLARQLADALHLPAWEDLRDAELEHLLDSAEADPLSETRHEKILTQARQLIHQGETPAMLNQIDAARFATPPRQPAALGTSTQPASRTAGRKRSKRSGSGSAVILTGIALLAMFALIFPSAHKKPSQRSTAKTETVSSVEYLPPGVLQPVVKPASPAAWKVAVGSTIETQARERRRVTLPDGSTLFLNENTQVEVKSARRLLVRAGEIFVEVVPQHLIESKSPFVVETPHKNITALGTKFLIKANKAETDVLVTQGKVKVSGVKEPVAAGQLLKEEQRLPAPRASEALLWTKELMASAESPLIPKSEHAGGALVAVDPSGQEMSLSLRKQHIDVHIEDGFARTTIDQTYFNGSWSQMEGTFYFPLPADASLSRLAMYVGENLMEGGMAERDHARNVFEQIRYTRRDPALLEWVDGSTFKMRVFPLEARQEKRLVISYTQRLASAYGNVHYRFPAGHSLELVRDWSTRVLVKNHAKRKWSSPSHSLNSKALGEDLVLETTAQSIVDDRDLVIELEDRQAANPEAEAARFSHVTHEGREYLMLRYRPDLRGELKRKPRNWVFLFESAGNRNSLLARVQIEVLHTLLKNAEHADTFSILTAGTRTQAWQEKPVACTVENVQAAIKHLNQVHLIGALDLEKALAACQPFVKAEQAESYLVHLGAGVAILGEQETETLLRRLPGDAKYVGIGVGKRWSQTFMKAAADHTGGYFTQINPDEEIGWRAFELLSLLNSPRVLNVKVTGDGSKPRFLQFSETLAQGEELCAIARLEEKAELPQVITITGTLAGKTYRQTIPVKDIAEHAGYLPRTWAKLEIDRLVASGAEQHKPEIIALSKAMYVMSPFTSLLVLENEAMYAQFNVDRGRQDHWAIYPCPPKIPVVYEPGGKPVINTTSKNTRAKSVEDLLQTVLVRIPPITYRWSNGQQSVTQGLNAWQLYTGAFAAPVQATQYLNYWAMPQSNGGGMMGGGIGGMMGGGGVGGNRFGLGIPNTWESYNSFSPDGYRRIGIDFDFNLQDSLPSDVNVNGNLRMWGRPANFGNVWMEESVNGIPVMPMFGGIPQIQSGPIDRKGTETWNRPVLLTAEVAQGIRNVDGEYTTNLNRLFSKRTRFDAYVNEGLIVSGTPFHPPNLEFVSGYRVNLLGNQILANPAVRLRISAPNDWDVDGTLLDLGAPGQFGKNAELQFLQFLGELPTPTPTGSNWSIGRFGDLPAFAPGLNTLSADVLSLLESHGPANLAPECGKIDPEAQHLIDSARRQGWETITLPSSQVGKSLMIRCDGQGRYIYERTVSEGLKERVLCDGESLLHLYEELGLGGKRTVSRFHRAELQRLIPWLIPPAEDLAVGCDVRSVGKHAIALVPLQNDKAEQEASRYLLMVFRPDGSLQERQVVDSKTNKPLLTVKFGEQGSVEVLDEAGKRISQSDWKRQPTKAPNLKPNLKDLVVLPMPFRTPESYETAAQQQLATNGQWLALDEEAALLRLGCYYAQGSISELTTLLQQRYFAKEDHRIGLYVLLAGLHQYTGLANPGGLLTQKHPHSPLAKYLAQQFQWANSGDNKDFRIDGPETGFIQRLTMARNLYARWSTGLAVNDRSAAEVKLERKRGLDSIRNLQSPELRWLLLKIMQAKDTDPQGLADYVQIAEEFAKQPRLSLQARYQAAFWRSELGETAEAVRELEALSQELLAEGILPPITATVRTGFINHAGTKAWAAYLEDLQTKFLKAGNRRAALLVAMRAARLKKDSLSESLMAQALKDLSPEKDPVATIIAAGDLMEQNRFADAEALLAPLLKLKSWSQQPGLWRKASEIAQKQNQEALSVARLERAMQLEYESLPELVNLQNIRTDYAGLLNRMEALAGAKNPETDLKRRAIRLADRWRVLDPDDTAACQVAARIVAKLGDRELAWDYLTTPLADKPNESAPWLALAQEMANQQNLEWADRAYRQAFEAESTNAQILWDHAEFLLRHNRREEAQERFEKLAQGDWQPRFSQLKTQAQQRLNGLLNQSKDIPK